MLKIEKGFEKKKLTFVSSEELENLKGEKASLETRKKLVDSSM